MRRRAFIGGVVLGAFAAPHVMQAQTGQKVYRIGVLNSSQKTSDLVGPQTRASSLNALLRGLRELGYVYGQDFVTVARGGESKPERFLGLAAELVRLQVDVIVAAGPTLHALKQATSTIPVVMAGGGDPKGEGLVQSLARPGRNFTGLSSQSVEVTAKRLELLKELVPSAAVVAILWDGGSLPHWRAAEAAARVRRWELLSIEIRDAGEIERAFKAASDARAGALLVAAAGMVVRHARRIADVAARTRLPAMYHLRSFVDAGGLISYGVDNVDIWRRAAVFVDKILKGAKPADLPMEQPLKFELVVNLKTAKALGLTIPPSLLLRADQIIE